MKPAQPAEALAQKPAEPTITAVIGESPVPTPAASAPLALADAQAPEESRAREIVGTEGGPPAQAAPPALALAEPTTEPGRQAPGVSEPVQTEIAERVPGPAQAPAPRMALAAPEAPGVAKPVVTPQVAETTAPVQHVQPERPAVAAVPKTGTNAWYLQLAAYTTEQIAQDLARELVPTYPTLVLSPGQNGSRMFRVMIGPLNRAESGTLLTWFRYRGFPDAFLKQE